MTYFGRDLDARAKTPTSFVSEADETTEVRVREELARAFPGEPILGEEFGLEREPEDRWWVVDPIDGTSNFLAGLSLFCVSLARMRGGRPELAITHDPVRGETFTAARGGGAFLGDRPLAVDPSPPGPLTMFAIRHSLVRRRPDLPGRLPSDKLRNLGSACLELAYIATGRLHGMVAQSAKLWDVAAGALLIEEAGGRVTTSEGRALFPLRHPPAHYVGHPAPIVAGSPEVAALLASLVIPD
jgi:myo-inositol-1(or 4)-monophosphatase